MAATLSLEGTPGMQRRGGQNTTACSRAGGRSRVSSVQLKPEATTRLRRALARIQGSHAFCAQRTVAESTVLGMKKLAALTLHTVGHFLRMCAVSTEEPGIAGLLARAAACGVPLTVSAQLGLPGA